MVSAGMYSVDSEIRLRRAIFSISKQVFDHETSSLNLSPVRNGVSSKYDGFMCFCSTKPQCIVNGNIA